jgi:hypothetical protein
MLKVATANVADPDPHGSTLILVGWIRIRIHRRAKMTQKNRKNEEIFCFEVLDVLF